MTEPWLIPLLYLDSPTVPADGAAIHVAGWIASQSAIDDIHVVQAPPRAVIELFDRGDVRQAYPGMATVVGFRTNVARSDLPEDCLEIRFVTAGRECRYRRRLSADIDPAVKAAKLERIAPLLRHDMAGTRTASHFDFLSEDLRRETGICAVDVVSSNHYDAHPLGLFSWFHDGLILDAGAGFNTDYQANVINLEIVPYPTTDVLGVGECLPFADGVFDAVLTLAVLEHVRDPFKCAAEIQRVLKPGGVVCAVVPFLQPYHGYPHHYYNMTHRGLANLFSDLHVIEQVVPPSGQPVWTLTWFLREYCEGLPEADREAFRQLKVEDLMAPPATLLRQRFVQALKSDARFTLASTTMLLARKPPQAEVARRYRKSASTPIAVLRAILGSALALVARKRR